MTDTRKPPQAGVDYTAAVYEYCAHSVIRETRS